MNQTEAFQQEIEFTLDEEGVGIVFDASSAFIQFPAHAVSKPVTLTFRRIRHKNCQVKSRNGEVFCSSIIKMEPEGFTFDRPVTVLLSHSAVEDGAYTDYYDLNMQKLKIECEDLETERISKLEDIPKEIDSNFKDIAKYLPVAKAAIKETGTLVVATKIRSEEIVVVPDELCVYPKSYGNESELEIFFPVGAVETECRLNVQVFPANDILDIGTGLNDGLICFPAIEVSGQDKYFLKPVKVEFVYSTIDVASLDEDLLPVGEEQPFTSKYGALLRSHKDSQGNQTWENVNNDATATIQHTQKDRLKISFSVEHFSKFWAFVKKFKKANVENVGASGNHRQKESPGLVAVCLASHEIAESRQKLYAVLAPKHKRKDLETEWGCSGEQCNDYLKDDDEVFFCIQNNFKLQDNNIRFFKDDITCRYNYVYCDETVLRQEMRFSRSECLDNMHYCKNGVGKCDITKKSVKADVREAVAGTPEMSVSASTIHSVETEREEEQRPPNLLQLEEVVLIAQRIPRTWKELASLTKVFETHEIDNIDCSRFNENESQKAFNMLTRYTEREGTRQKLADALKKLKMFSLAQDVLSGSFISD